MAGPIGGPTHHTAGKLAQLLGEVITHHTPHTAEVGERIKRKLTDEWLDRLEDHSTMIIGPLIDKVLEDTNPPDEIRHIMEQMAHPTAALGSFAEQFLVYGIGFSIAGVLIEPFTQELSNTLWKQFPERPMSPADAATAITQGVNFADPQGVDIPEWAYDEALMSGINRDRFATLVGAAGQAPDGTDLFEMFRREIITAAQLRDGFIEGPTKNKWIPFLQKLQYTPLTVADMVRAAVQAQLPYSQAEDLAHKLGLEPAGWVADNPDWFKIAFDISGRPPGPELMGRMANRGIIGWTGTGPDETTFEQGIAESDVKPKWTDALRKIQEYVPPPRSVGALLKSGSITSAQAKQYWEDGGVPATLADAYVHQALTEETATEKALAKGEVTTLLYDGLISTQVALDLLGVLGFNGQTATYIVEITNFKRRIQALNTASRRVGSLYVAYKMTATDAKESLQQLGVPADQITALLATWDIERRPQVRLPTMAQLGKAVQYAGLPFDVAVSKAQLLGYTAYDATLIIAAEAQYTVPEGQWPVDTDTGVDV